MPYIVVLKDQPDSGTSYAMMKAQAASSQATVLSSISAIDRVAAQSAEQFWIVNAIAIEADDETIERIALLPGVDHVEPVMWVQVDDPVYAVSDTVDAQYIRTSDEFMLPWNIDWIETPAVWNAGNRGEGVTIAVVDTGIDGSHPAFAGRVKAFADFVSGDNTSAYDDNGHGTHCAGTAAGGEVTVSTSDGDYDVALGVAPGADLIGAKVLNSEGFGNSINILKGIQWAIDNGADVISLSVGSNIFYVGETCHINETDVSIEPGETFTLTLELGGGNITYNEGRYEPQFVVGGYTLPEMGGVAMAFPYDEPEPANLSMALYAPGMTPAVGGYIDWDGFDHNANQVTFKAPYVNNSANWAGFWTLEVTNNENYTVQFDYLHKIRIAAAYQSNGETAYDQALNNLASEGVVAVVAAGNAGYYGTGTIGTPGTAKDVITVGATDYCMDYRATFSSIGPVNRASPYVKPDLMAPGVGIVSAYPNEYYAVMDGTSMATPGVAGAVALMLAGNDTLTPAEVKETLMDTAVHIKEDGTAMATYEGNNLYGAGRINAYSAVEATGGLHGTAPLSYLTELLGGSSYDGSVDPNNVKMLAVCWNATAGAPMAGETVSFSVYQPGTDPINTTGVTDVNGMATATVDISNFPENYFFYTETTWDGRTLSDSHYKYDPPNSGGMVGEPPEPIFVAQDFLVATNGSLTIQYPLLHANGSAYTEPVRLQVTNGTPLFDANLTPVKGVVEATIDFSQFNVNPDDRNIDVLINGRDAGRVSFSYWIYYEAFSSPKLAICPPGSSIDIALQVADCQGGSTITSKDYDVYVTAFTETQILSLPSDLSGPLAAGMPVDDAALIEATGGMKSEEFVGKVQVRNGIGIYDFEMPEGCYVAVVKFADPEWGDYGSYDLRMVSVVYGSMSPWTLHRVTPTMPVALNEVDSTYIRVYDFDWPATWDQENYCSVPGDRATLTAAVYISNSTTETGAPGVGKTVWLYTADGVQMNTTGADGTCAFTLDVAGKTFEDVILITDGISTYGLADEYLPFYPDQKSRINPGILSGEQQAAAYIQTLYPDSEYRWMDVDYQGNGAYMVSLHSVGPDDEAIAERGIFTGSPITSMYSLGTEFASTLDYAGTWAMNLTPSQNGTYEATAHILVPGTGSFNWMGQNFGVGVDYTVKKDVLAGETVPVTFTVTDNDGTPISGAKVGFFLGGAATSDYGVYDDEVRSLNLLHMANIYPDPYSEVQEGYTNANGQVALYVHAPSQAMMIERNALGFSDYVPYRVSCYKDEEVLKGGGGPEDYGRCDGAFMLTADALPDFVPSVQAPHVVKLNRDDSIAVNNLYLLITNQGTADFVHTDRDIVVRASVGSRDQSTTYSRNIAMGETAQALHTSVQAYASDFGINTSDYRLPVNTNINVTVNPGRTIDELSYANNNIVHPVRITAPDLAAEVQAPSTVIQTGTPTPIALVVTNLGEVPAVQTTMTYLAPGSATETINVPALGPGESYSVWRNKTLLASPGTYTLTLEVNPNGATDHETTFANNRVTRTVHCYLHPSTSIVLPQEQVLVPGTTYDLPIVVNGAENLAAYQMTFTFDPAIVTVTDVTGNAIPLTAKNIGTGTVAFNGGTTTGISGNVTVATIHLSAIGSSGDETVFGLAAQLWDAAEYPIPVEVTAGSAVLLLYGDANGDGVVDQADTLRVLKEVVGLTVKPTAGSTDFLQTDVHENCAIEVGDAMFIAQKNAGLRDPYFRIL